MMIPITDVLSSAGTYDARKAVRGAPSICAVQNRAIRRALATPKVEGKGMSARKIAEGRWVKAMVLMLPIRRAREAATRLERLATKDVVKKVVPSVPSLRLNLVEKK